MGIFEESIGSTRNKLGNKITTGNTIYKPSSLTLRRLVDSRYASEKKNDLAGRFSGRRPIEMKKSENEKLELEKPKSNSSEK